MENKYNNIEELKNIAPTIVNLWNQNPYSIPESYFDSLPDSVLNYIKLAEIRGINSYSLPENFFDTLADSILYKIRLSSSKEIYKELSEIAPLLASVNKQNVFSIPVNYFENLTISDTAKPSIKVISIGNNFKKWVTYVAAASVLFIVAVTSYLYVSTHNHDGDALTIEQRLARLKDQEIINYLKENDEITSGDIVPASVEEDPDIQNMLQDASNEEIQKYLDEYSEPAEKTVKGI